MSKSIVPEAFREANKTTVSLGLGVLVAIVYGAYRLGQEASTAPETLREQAAEIKAQGERINQIDVRLEKLVTSTEAMARTQESQARDVRAQQEAMAILNTEVQVISSHVQKRR